MRFSILEFGMMKVDSNSIVDKTSVATLSNPTAPNKLIDIPIWGLLIQCEGHNIIYDLGCMDNAMTTGWRRNHQDGAPYFPMAGGTMEERLASVGLTISDIDIVVVSHLHIDHFGCIEKFCHCEVYVPKEEWINAMMLVFGSSDESAHGGYYIRAMTTPVRQYHFIGVDEDFDLFPGLRILTLPGHTANLLGLMITTDNGEKYIFPSDAVYVPANIGPPTQIPGYCFDPLAYTRSCEKLRRLIRETGATLVYSHDYTCFNTLKKVPDFYD
ncbi:MAG: N-acyl homoserine lactonase family protein [Syntrophomonadaceae bacterium]|nr:N-acyl homoserine lactonase family protein [Syntrophomonadaceae bacterium]